MSLFSILWAWKWHKIVEKIFLHKDNVIKLNKKIKGEKKAQAFMRRDCENWNYLKILILGYFFIPIKLIGVISWTLLCYPLYLTLKLLANLCG